VTEKLLNRPEPSTEARMRFDGVSSMGDLVRCGQKAESMG